MKGRTNYVSKISENRSGEPIQALHGVTQGRKSLTSLFSFTMRNIPKSVKLPTSFLNGIHILQLADDSSVITNTIESLIHGFSQLIDASNSKFMVTNLLKTFYLHLSDDTYKDVIELVNGCEIKFAENDEHLYLGIWFIASACITAQMKCNLNHRGYNIKKFYDWLDVNQMTPIIIKLLVLDLCMFGAYLYGCECWSTIDEVAESILVTEHKLLKRILQVKPRTPNEIVYTELGRCDTISTIKMRQKRFFQRCKKLSTHDSAKSDQFYLYEGFYFI